MSYGHRKALYSAAELMAGFDPADEIGFSRSYDFRAFQTFHKDGGPAPKTPQVHSAQAAHDASISHALHEWLGSRPGTRLVGVMGGHKVARNEPAYADVARLARELTRHDFLIVTGGGPGAMEAAHLGAMLAHVEDAALEIAITRISAEPKLPNLANLLDENGDVPPSRLQDLKDGHRWFTQALSVLDLSEGKPGTSLAIPTWLYGQEPTMPFASVYAKYFQNSIREEALVHQATSGIIYGRGGGGTIREIFQDVEQNYYCKTSAEFTPMIFFDPEGYWERSATYKPTGEVDVPGVRLDVVLEETFRFARARAGDAEKCLAKVRFTTEPATILALLEAHSPSAAKALNALLSSNASKMLRASWNR